MRLNGISLRETGATKSIFVLAGRNYFRSFIKQAIVSFLSNINYIFWFLPRRKLPGFFLDVSVITFCVHGGSRGDCRLSEIYASNIYTYIYIYI